MFCNKKLFNQSLPKNISKKMMQKLTLDDLSSFDVATVIEEVIVVGLTQNCRCVQNTEQFKWITSLAIISHNQYQTELLSSHHEHPNIKFVEIGNGLYLKIWFCQKNKKAITKIKSSKRFSNSDLNPIPYPFNSVQEEYLCFMAKQNGKVIIEDVEMVQIKADSEIQMPQENSYEIIRLPIACQRIEKQQYSNSEEQMITKTRYLLVKTLDLEEQEQHLIQRYEPSVIFQHSMRNKSTLIHYNSFHEFCFPEGVQLHKQILGYGYSIFNFILTQEDGNRVYVNCLKFKEKLDENILQTLPANCIDKHIHNHEVMYTEKALCLLSKYCFTQFFHDLLQELFRKYQSSHNQKIMKINGKTLENQKEPSFHPIIMEFIEKYEIGYRELEKKYNEYEYLKEAIHIQIEWDHHKIIFPLPEENIKSYYSPKAVHCLFKMLSIEKIVQIVQALLLEQTVIFVSNSQVVVGYAIESLVSFLYPLKWQHVILPILPYELLNLLEAPMPLIAGIPTNLATDDLIRNLREQTVIVFLDCNDVLHKGIDREVTHLNHFKEAIKKLRGYNVYVRNHVNSMLQVRDQFYLFKIYEKEENHFSAEHIKHIFFELILLLLQGYENYYSRNCNISPSKNPKESKDSDKKRSFNFKKDYDIQRFIHSHPKRNYHFMRRFTETSHFITFIHNYNDSKQNPCKSFIDSALRKQSMANDFPVQRYSEPCNNSLDVTYLKKKMSCSNNNAHNMTWSPPPKKVEDMSETNYTRNINSVKIEDIEQIQREKPCKSAEQLPRKESAGGNICDAISKAIQQMSNTKKNLAMWTSAKVNRLKKEYYDQKQKEHHQEQCEVKGQKMERRTEEIKYEREEPRDVMSQQI